MFESAPSSGSEVAFGFACPPWDESVSGVRTENPPWDQIDRRLRVIAKRRSALDVEEARWLVVARREGLHRHLGFAISARELLSYKAA